MSITQGCVVLNRRKKEIKLRWAASILLSSRVQQPATLLETLKLLCYFFGLGKQGKRTRFRSRRESIEVPYYSRQCKRKHSLRLTDAVCNINIEYKSKIVHRKYKQ